jgi:hypothetical protein
MRSVGMIFSFAIAMNVAAASMPPAIMNAVFLGTVGRLQAAMASDFTAGMAHALVASVLICALAVVCSIVREGRRGLRARRSSIVHAPAPAASSELSGVLCYANAR